MNLSNMLSISTPVKSAGKDNGRKPIRQDHDTENPLPTVNQQDTDSQNRKTFEQKKLNDNPTPDTKPSSDEKASPAQPIENASQQDIHSTNNASVKAEVPAEFRDMVAILLSNNKLSSKQSEIPVETKSARISHVFGQVAVNKPAKSPVSQNKAVKIAAEAISSRGPVAKTAVANPTLKNTDKPAESGPEPIALAADAKNKLSLVPDGIRKYTEPAGQLDGPLHPRKAQAQPAVIDQGPTSSRNNIPAESNAAEASLTEKIKPQGSKAQAKIVTDTNAEAKPHVPVETRQPAISPQQQTSAERINPSEATATTAAVGFRPASRQATATTDAEPEMVSRNATVLQEVIPIQSAEPTNTGQIGTVPTQTGQSAPAAPAEQIATEIQLRQGDLGEEITVTLSPPELGKVRIEFRNDGQGLRGVIHVENARTLSDLQQEAPTLIQKLNEAGISVKDMEFQMNDPNQGRGEHNGNQARNAYAMFGETGSGNNGGRAGSEGQNRDSGLGGYDWDDDTSAGWGAGQYVGDDILNVMV